MSNVFASLPVWLLNMLFNLFTHWHLYSGAEHGIEGQEARVYA